MVLAYLGHKTEPSRVPVAFYLATLFLLPWSWFPPFPWFHEHAQWSDVCFAVTAAAWIAARWRAGDRPRLRPLHLALLGYFGAATFSLALGGPVRAAGAVKLLGIAELCLLTVVTSDLVSRAGVPRLAGRTILLTSLLTAAAALTGFIVFLSGGETLLVGRYGDLVASPWYARVQAGLYHPNLLASFCIFSSAVIAREDSDVPVWLRRATQAALWAAILLTFSRGVLAFVVAAAIRGARTRRRRVVTTALVACCLGIMMVLTVWNISVNPMRPFEVHVDNSEPSSRWQAITSSLRTLGLHPLGGSGLENAPGRYRAEPFDAHLTPLNIAATMGLPALAAFVALLVILWRTRGHPIDVALWSGMAAMLIDGLTQDIEDFRHLWVMIGLLDAESQSSRCRRGRGTG